MHTLNATEFTARLTTLASRDQLKKYERFFPVNARGGDVFIGVRMGDIFTLAKDYKDLPLKEIETLLESPIHEIRVGAVSIMDFKARDRHAPESVKKDLFNLYLRRHDRINNWDLVDRSALHVVGDYLLDKPRGILYELAISKNMWERRTAIVATITFALKGDTADTFKIAELLLDEKEDLIQKATGWALRSAGGSGLIAFLDTHVTRMPRVTLRYATERLDKDVRNTYLKR